MIKFFAYDIEKNQIIVNEPEILLIKEFADIWTNEYNKCPEDPDGHKKLKGYRELVYIYIAIDWGAPGSKDTPANRRLYALDASKIDASEFDDQNIPIDPLFKAACARYLELLESSSIVGGIRLTYINKIHEMQEFVKSIDYNERSDSGMPIFKIKDTLAEMQAISKALDSLLDMENRYKEEQQEASGLRGDTTPGMFD